jgi:hypothetical protein
MIAAKTLFALFLYASALGGRHRTAADAADVAQVVIDATPEPLLFPGERVYWIRQGWYESRWAASPVGHNDAGAACGWQQLNRWLLPFGACEEHRADRVLNLRAARVLLARQLARCGSVRAAVGAYMTGGACGAAPKLTALRCGDAC